MRTHVNQFLGASLLFATVTFLVSCATPYQSQAWWRSITGIPGGYSEKKINDSAYVVAFEGNGYTSKDRLWTYWIYRCAELTVQNGYDLFALAPRTASTKTSRREDGLVPAVYRPGAERGRSVKVRNGGAVVPIYIPQGGAAQARVSTAGVVLMFRNPLPENVLWALDARNVMRELSVYVKSGGSLPNPDEVMRRAFVAHVRVDIGYAQTSQSPGTGSGGHIRQAEDVMRVVDQNRLFYYDAFQAYVQRAPDNAGGTVVMSFAIDANGIVSDCRVESSTIADPAFVETVRMSVQRTNFGPGDVLPVRVTSMPIAFAASHGIAQQGRHSAEHPLVPDNAATNLPAVPSSESGSLQRDSVRRTRVSAPLRAQPGGDIRTTLSAGTPVTLISELQNDTGFWWFVSAGNSSGWLRAVEISGTER
jgi:hypothetical protein